MTTPTSAKEASESGHNLVDSARGVSKPTTDPAIAYTEACGMLRQYSNSSLTVRITTIVQGTAMLLAWGYTVTQTVSAVVLVFPLAGLLFTLLLYRFHLTYFRATTVFYNSAADIESALFAEGHRPISQYDAYHQRTYSTPLSMWLNCNAPFTLTILLFFAAIGFSILHIAGLTSAG